MKFLLLMQGNRILLNPLVLSLSKDVCCPSTSLRFAQGERF